MHRHSPPSGSLRSLRGGTGPSAFFVDRLTAMFSGAHYLTAMSSGRRGPAPSSAGLTAAYSSVRNSRFEVSGRGSQFDLDSAEGVVRLLVSREAATARASNRSLSSLRRSKVQFFHWSADRCLMRTRSVVSTVSGNSSVPIVDSVPKATRAPVSNGAARGPPKSAQAPRFAFLGVLEDDPRFAREIEREATAPSRSSSGWEEEIHGLALAQGDPQIGEASIAFLDARPRRRAYVGREIPVLTQCVPRRTSGSTDTLEPPVLGVSKHFPHLSARQPLLGAPVPGSPVGGQGTARHGKY